MLLSDINLKYSCHDYYLQSQISPNRTHFWNKDVYYFENFVNMQFTKTCLHQNFFVIFTFQFK